MNFYLRLFILLIVVASCSPKHVDENFHFAIPENEITTDSLQQLLLFYTTTNLEVDGKRKEIILLMLEGMLSSRKAAYEIAENSYSKAITLLQNPYDTLLMANAQQGLANALKNQSEYSQSLVAFKESLKLYESLDDMRATANVHGYIAQVFQLQNDLKQAEAHLLDGFNILGDDTNNISFLVLMHTLANVYGMEGKFKEALALDERGIFISTSLKLPESTATFLDNKANCFLYSNRLDSAAYYFKQCLLLDTANIKQQSDTWLRLGMLADMQGNTSQAIAHFQQSLQLSEAAAYKAGQMLAWEALTEIYKKNQNLSAALEAQNRFFSIKDSILNIQKTKAVEEWKVVYNTETKDKTILLNQLTIQKKNILIVAVGLVSIMVIIGFWMRNKRSKQLRQKEFERTILDKEQQAIIDILSAEEKERKRIAEDLHDGIGQSLTAVRLQLQALGNSSPSPHNNENNKEHIINKATSQLESCCAEVRALSHNLMPDLLLEHGLESALHRMIANIDKHVLAINLDYTLDHSKITKTSQLLIYRIIQECLSNVLKHAKATELDLCICEEDKHIAVLIEDNGIGFETTDAMHANGIGMHNITSRVQFLNGNVEWNSTPGEGTVIALFIPLTHGK